MKLTLENERNADVAVFEKKMKLTLENERNADVAVFEKKRKTENKKFKIHLLLEITF